MAVHLIEVFREIIDWHGVFSWLGNTFSLLLVAMLKW